MRNLVITFATLGLGMLTAATCDQESEAPGPSPRAQQVSSDSRQAAGPPSEQTQAYARRDSRD